MHFFTLSAVVVAALAFLATPDVAAAMPVADLAARSAELNTRSAEPEARPVDFLCQVAGIRGCTMRCFFKPKTNGGHCNLNRNCVCDIDDIG
ncbi:MAG: hypothetical protein Q9172_007766 [Xanthocarpia lactea]